MWQAMSPEEARAKILNKAMVGLGTAEDQLIRVISQLNFGERREVKEAYQRMFGKDLVEHIRSETSDILTSKDFQKALLCMLEVQNGEQTVTVHYIAAYFIVILLLYNLNVRFGNQQFEERVKLCHC